MLTCPRAGASPTSQPPASSAPSPHHQGSFPQNFGHLELSPRSNFPALQSDVVIRFSFIGRCSLIISNYRDKTPLCGLGVFLPFSTTFFCWRPDQGLTGSLADVLGFQTRPFLLRKVTSTVPTPRWPQCTADNSPPVLHPRTCPGPDAGDQGPGRAPRYSQGARASKWAG